MKKKIYKYSLLFGIILAIVIIVVETIIIKKFNVNYSLAFIIGLLTGLLAFFLSDKSLERLEFNTVSKPKVFYTLVHIIKYIIYGIILYLSTYLLGTYTSFACAFGMLFNKIVIYLLNLVIIPKQDKVRSVDQLKLPKYIIDKLKYNDFIKVVDITNVDRNKLLTFLTNKEVELVIKSLKEFELFIKGELEAIIEDENVDV